MIFRLLFVSLLGWSAGVGWASDADKPHPHQGVLAPITRAPAAVQLTAEEVATLQSGERVEHHSRGDDGGSGVAVQYISASPQTIWGTILSYHRYKDWVKNVRECSIYKRDGNDLYVDMQISVFGFRSGFYTRNTVRKDEGYMSWTLDYSRKSDVDDMVGYWRVEAVTTDPPLTKLEYSTQMKMKGVPGFVVDYLTRDALGEGTDWVKLRAEQAQAK